MEFGRGRVAEIDHCYGECRSMVAQESGSPVRSLSNRWFELLLVTIVLGVTLIAHHVVNVSAVMLHFFYLPVLIAANYFGRTLAALTAVFSVLAVVIFAMLDPQHYMAAVDSKATLYLTLGAWAGFLGMNALLVGSLFDQRMAHMKELRQAYLGIVEVLSKYLQAADQYTKSHSMRVASMAEAIAEKLGMKQIEIENIRVGSLLHDIGKVEISTRLIQKAAGLTDSERAEMETHTVQGAELVSSLGTILEGAVPIIMHHHDHYSSSSKAEGRHGNDIPIGARIVAVADAYDAIVTDRPYRRGRTPAEAVAIIQEQSGRQFDPKVVAAFEKVMATRGDELENEAAMLRDQSPEAGIEAAASELRRLNAVLAEAHDDRTDAPAPTERVNKPVANGTRGGSSN